MKTTTLIIGLLLLAALVVPVVAAPVEYPEEYYSLMNENRYFFELHHEDLSMWSDRVEPVTAAASIASARELHRHSILLEKQNELLAEQSHILWVQTCYKPNYYDSVWGAAGNVVAWREECAAAGYPV